MNDKDMAVLDLLEKIVSSIDSIYHNNLCNYEVKELWDGLKEIKDVLND